jgi:hypothetical protein
MARLDSKLEAAGAEFLALGHLLAEGIQVFKAYTNFPGYDIIATDPQKRTSCRIQVKSRWATDYDGGFPMRNYECDFVVFVALNRGYRYRKKARNGDTGRRSPQLYVFPVEVVRKARYERSKWGKSFLRRMDDPDQYLGNWDLVKSFLNR